MQANWVRWCFTALLVQGLAACASSGTTREQSAEVAQPTPQKIQLQAQVAENQPDARPQIIEKDLFNISVSPQMIRVNGTPVADVAALGRLLAAYPKPMITLAAHKCLSTAASAEVMNLAQQHTDIAIAFGSYGDYDDDECQPLPAKKR